VTDRIKQLYHQIIGTLDTDSNNQKLKQLNVRWSEELRQKLEKRAKQNCRSLNEEMFRTLEESLRREDLRELIGLLTGVREKS